MNHSELEQNLLSEKDDFERSEKDDFEEVLLTTWSPRSYRRLLHFRNFLQDLIQSQGQRLIVASLILVNIFFLIYILTTRNHNECYNQSPIVGLVPNAFERTMSILTPYATPRENNTARDQLWEDIAVDRGAVAVDEKIVAKYGLPDTMVFPWDSSKRVYIVNAFHQLHCLKFIYRTMTSVYNGDHLPVKRYEHVVHCLDQLRQDVHCQADDNLYYIGDVNAGHVRQCRDFSRLDEWALEHHACYSFEKPPKAGLVDIEAFANCRESSPYLQTMKNYFGFGENWQPSYPPHEGPTFKNW